KLRIAKVNTKTPTTFFTPLLVIIILLVVQIPNLVLPNNGIENDLLEELGNLTDFVNIGGFYGFFNILLIIRKVL
ncbi:MAG: hypothetical protein MZV63_04280, partial [Marinilabiliales bacterium]|nr:hypothetical protein [Marinilabiliales bacterium]